MDGFPSKTLEALVGPRDTVSCDPLGEITFVPRYCQLIVPRYISELFLVHTTFIGETTDTRHRPAVQG